MPNTKTLLIETSNDTTASAPAAKKAKAKPTAKKAAVKNPAAKKAAKPAAKKATAKKAAKPAAKRVAQTPAEKKASKKATALAARKAAMEKSPLYLSKDKYKECIDGLMAQGLEHKDAVETLKVGLRQANGRPVPLELLMNQPANEPVTQLAA